MAHGHSSYQTYPFLPLFALSSSTLLLANQSGQSANQPKVLNLPTMGERVNVMPVKNLELRQRLSNSGKKRSSRKQSVMVFIDNKANSRFGAPIALPTTTAPFSPPPYAPNLTPQPSPLRPHCLARDRLRLWRPAVSPSRAGHNQLNPISEEQLECILQVINAAWAESTKTLYGAGLLVFHVYCDTHGIPEDRWCPLSAPLLLAFLSSCAGSYSGASLSNYVAGLKAWHLLHSHQWDINPAELKTVLEGAGRLTPPSSKRAAREPFTPDTLMLLKTSLNLEEPLHAAVFACVTMCFWSVARLGELTVPNIQSFDAQKHITRANVSQVTDRDGKQVTKFFIPFTKTAGANGESIQCARQDSPVDPITALENHLHINKVDPSDHLFAWRAKKGLRPLSKRQVISFISDLAKMHNLPNMKGHSLRIGGTLEYLLRGVPFDIIQAQGRWASRAFTLYLRKHTMILAPYLQASQPSSHSQGIPSPRSDNAPALPNTVRVPPSRMGLVSWLPDCVANSFFSRGTARLADPLRFGLV